MQLRPATITFRKMRNFSRLPQLSLCPCVNIRHQDMGLRRFLSSVLTSSFKMRCSTHWIRCLIQQDTITTHLMRQLLWCSSIPITADRVRSLLSPGDSEFLRRPSSVVVQSVVRDLTKNSVPLSIKPHWFRTINHCDKVRESTTKNLSAGCHPQAFVRQ